MGLIRRLYDYMIVLNQGQLLEEGKPEDVLQKTMDQYNATDTEIDDICEKIIDVAANAGKILKSPIISLKRDFLRLILSDFVRYNPIKRKKHLVRCFLQIDAFWCY